LSDVHGKQQLRWGTQLWAHCIWYILHYTRNIPTAIALETSKGEFAQGIALGIVLLLLAFILNGLLHLFQGKGTLS